MERKHTWRKKKKGRDGIKACPALSLTWVKDLRIKYRLGKYCVSMPELVDAYDPELLECCAGFLNRRACGPSSSLDNDNAPILCEGSSGELSNASEELFSGLVAALALACFCFRSFT